MGYNWISFNSIGIFVAIGTLGLLWDLLTIASEYLWSCFYILSVTINQGNVNIICIVQQLLIIGLFECDNYSREKTIQGRKLLIIRTFWVRQLFKGDNYSRETTILGRKLFAEVRYITYHRIFTLSLSFFDSQPLLLVFWHFFQFDTFCNYQKLFSIFFTSVRFWYVHTKVFHQSFEILIQKIFFGYFQNC